MKIIGEAQLEYIYPDGTREPVSPPVQNHICWPTWRRIMTASLLTWPTKRDATSQLSAGPRWYVFITSSDIKATVLNAWCRSNLDTAVDQGTPTWTDRATANDPDVVTFTATIAAPSGSPRTIRVLGLFCDSYYDPSACSQMKSKLTILKLTTPCVQQTNVQLAVTYRLYLYPTVEMLSHRTSARIYEDIRQLFKTAGQAVNSTYVNYRGLVGNLSSTSFECDGITPLALTSVPVTGGGGTSDHEQTDNGIIVNSVDTNGTPVAYQGGFSNTISLTTTATPSLGVFCKNLWLGDAGRGSTGSGPSEMSQGLIYQPILPGVTDPRQNTYRQRNTPVGPLQDTTPANIATMSGSITLNADNWVDPYMQKLFRVRIGTTGNLSTPATYQVDVFDFHAGFVGNRWSPRTAIIPQAITNGRQFRGVTTDVCYESESRFGGTAYRTPDGTRYVAAFNCMRSVAGIAIYDILRGTKKVFNATSTPALGVTAVSDGECTKGYTFVGCSNTGLWRINPAMNTVEQIPAPVGVTNKVYQMCAKKDVNGTLWVLYDGGLCKLSNPDAAVGSLSWTVHNPTTGSPTFTYTGITDSNWDKVTSMVIDPDNASDRFLFTSSVLAGGSTTENWRLGWVWWDTTTGVAANPLTDAIPYSSFTWTQANLLRISDSVRCSEGRWVVGTCWSDGSGGGDGYSRLYHFTYGANNMQTLYVNTPDNARAVPVTIGSSVGFITAMTNGNNDYSGVFVKGSTLAGLAANANIQLASPANIEFALRSGPNSYVSEMATTNTLTGNLSRVLLYLPGSNMFFSHEYSIDAYGVTPFMLRPSHSKYNTYKSVFWKKYGWNGASWVRDNPGYRSVHSGLNDLPDLDGLRISFANGVTGTSFVAGEFWTSIVGKGLMKDNGTTLNSTFSWSLDATGVVAISGNVPTAALGALTDEPVTFSLVDANTTEGYRDPDASSGGTANTRMLQNKGILVSHPRYGGASEALVGDQLIPASTDFDFRFKWISFEALASTHKTMGVATGTGTYTYGLHFRYNPSTSNLEVYNDSTLVGTVIPNPSVDAECRIARVGTTVSAYYNGTLVGSVTSSSAFVIYSVSGSTTMETGWWDMKITYTENRRVFRVGSAAGAGTGQYSSKFMGLTSCNAAGDLKVYIGSGSPLLANLDYTTAGAAIPGTGYVKVATGAGWLIFHGSEPANPISGTAVAHYVNDNF